MVKIDQKHQLFFDRNYQIYLINITPVAKKISKNRDIVTVNQKIKIPGNISDEQLQEINDL